MVDFFLLSSVVKEMGVFLYASVKIHIARSANNSSDTGMTMAIRRSNS